VHLVGFIIRIYNTIKYPQYRVTLMCTVLLSRTSTSGYSAVNYSMRHISEVSCVCVSQTYLSKEQFRVQNTQEERKRDPESNTAK